jgi:proteic killer suppression protein
MFHSTLSEDPTHLGGLNRIREPGDARVFPGWQVHPLTGDLAGFRSVTVTSNGRIIFRFEQGRVLGVDLVDYP